MAKDGVERKLTTILAADVVGYSRLMATDEVATLAALKAQRRELVEPKLEAYGGRIVKLMGDGELMEFASVVDALNYAVEVQHAVAERNAEVPEDRRIVYRVGLNIGDIMVDGEDIYGDGVNIAARLEGLAEPGGICVAQNVYNQVRSKLDLDFEDMGEQAVKNIPDPVRVYAVKLEGSAKAAPERKPQDKAPPKLVDRPSIAVLPFDNMSGDPEQEYFADGIVEDIITELSRDPDLFVIARNSSFAYKGQISDIPQVARELGVRYVLEGSVRKAGNRIRLNAQLVEAESGHHVWAERYDRTLEDVFAVQDDLTNTIQNRLVQRVRDSGIEGLMRQVPADMNAYDHMLRAMGLLLRFNRSNNEEAMREARAALDLDPNYGRAHAMLAWGHLYSVWSAWADDIEQAIQQGHVAAKEAVAVDRNDYWSYAALGFAELCKHRNDHAVAALDRAVALNPNSADVHAMRGVALNYLGRPEEALRDLELAFRHNPHYPDWYLMGSGRAYYMLGRYEEAIPILERATTALPELTIGRLLLAAVYVAADRQAQAEAEVKSVLTDSPTVTLDYVRAVVPFQKDEDLERYCGLLRQAGLPD